jgi:hypothetical protein
MSVFMTVNGVSNTPAPGGTEKTGGTGGGSPPTQKSGYRTVEDLRNQEPEFWEQYIQALAMEICNKSKKHTDRIKKAMKRMRE